MYFFICLLSLLCLFQSPPKYTGFLGLKASHPHDFAGELLDAGVNRSPSAYLNNPEAEQKKYEYNVDKEMTLLKFVDDEWGPVGSFNWFATHGTSMSRTNSLISGDNKGAAARFMEDWFEKNASLIGSGSARFNDSGTDRILRRVSCLVSNHKTRKLKTSTC